MKYYKLKWTSLMNETELAILMEEWDGFFEFIQVKEDRNIASVIK